jgi:transcriptional regulator with XRE-family HTH domain
MVDNKPQDPSPEALISRRVREERLKRGWTLVQLAERSGVSRAMISKIERAQASPTAVLLSRLADALGLGLTSLMSDRPQSRPALRRLREQPYWRDPSSGYVRRLVSPAGGDGDTEIVAIDLPAGAAIRFEASDHLRTDEQVLLLEGRLRLELGDDHLDLAPGDCARIDVSLPHAFCNAGPAAARYLVVMRH